MSHDQPSACLLFALGPVQDFIATARKGRDLWFGSWLLAELSRVAAQAAQGAGADLILPGPAALTRGDAVANKIVARAPVGVAQRVAEHMERDVRARLNGLADRVFERIGREPGGRWLHREAAVAQVADLPEIYWVVVREVAGGWRETRRNAEAALAARKSLRDFGPVSWGAPVPKSRLDGQRESVIDEAAFEAANLGQLRRTFGVGPAERLCGVGLLKRNGHRVLEMEDARGARVISTAHVASWSLRRAWAEATAVHGELRRAFEVYLGALPDGGESVSDVPVDHAPDPVLGRKDGQILYLGRLADLYDGEELRRAGSALSKFLRLAREALERARVVRPVLSPYYAVLRADGDKIGAWLDSMSDPQDHQKASDALGDFAMAAERTVTTHHGHCIFAGGDDVLALLPVATALDCAAALNVDFAAAIRAGPTTGTGTPSLSLGIQISHATDSFRGALEGAAEAERAAKHTFKRAAFAVRLDKRSGAPMVVGGKWEELAAFRALQRLQEADVGGIPRGLAHDLRGVADRLHVTLGGRREISEDESAALGRIRRLEVERVLRLKEHGLGAGGEKAIWDRLGESAVGEDILRRACDELMVTRALAALDREDA